MYFFANRVGSLKFFAVYVRKPDGKVVKFSTKALTLKSAQAICDDFNSAINFNKAA